MYATQKPKKPSNVLEEEKTAYMLTILLYKNDELTGNLQLEFSSYEEMREHIRNAYDKTDRWNRRNGYSEFSDDYGNNHLLVLQKIRKIEKVTKILEEDKLSLDGYFN